MTHTIILIQFCTQYTQSHTYDKISASFEYNLKELFFHFCPFSESAREMATSFQKYLKQKLKEIQLDESVYTEYITSILEDETSDDEKRETLEEVLSGVLVRQD